MSTKSPKITLLLSLFLVVGIAALVAVAQRGGQRRGGRGGGRDQALLNAPYVGIVTSKGKQEGLFKIAQTGVSTDEVREAAEAFLDCEGVSVAGFRFVATVRALFAGGCAAARALGAGARTRDCTEAGAAAIGTLLLLLLGRETCTGTLCIEVAI